MYQQSADIWFSAKKSGIGIFSQVKALKFYFAIPDFPNIAEFFPYLTNMAEKFPLTQ
jgi:hypothetical protein